MYILELYIYGIIVYRCVLIFSSGAILVIHFESFLHEIYLSTSRHNIHNIHGQCVWQANRINTLYVYGRAIELIPCMCMTGQSNEYLVYV